MAVDTYPMDFDLFAWANGRYKKTSFIEERVCPFHPVISDAKNAPCFFKHGALYLRTAVFSHI